jgi:uncharacterized membrane protein YkvA (DUF1232 family)
MIKWQGANGRPPLFKRWKELAKKLEIEIYALALAYRDARTPWYARAWVALVVAYAVSPIDLIPDFIPLLGYLDDLVIVPAGVWLALRMIPPEVMAGAREKANLGLAPGKGAKSLGVVIVIGVWLIILGAIIILIWKFLAQK